jgi:hypothetical protein
VEPCRWPKCDRARSAARRCPILMSGNHTLVSAKPLRRGWSMFHNGISRDSATQILLARMLPN